MSLTKARILTVAHKHAIAVLRGQAKIIYPPDAEVMGYQTDVKGGLNVMVHSMTYSGVPRGQPLPVVAAQVEFIQR